MANITLGFAKFFLFPQQKAFTFFLLPPWTRSLKFSSPLGSGKMRPPNWALSPNKGPSSKSYPDTPSSITLRCSKISSATAAEQWKAPVVLSSSPRGLFHLPVSEGLCLRTYLPGRRWRWSEGSGTWQACISSVQVSAHPWHPVAFFWTFLPPYLCCLSPN